MLDSTFNSSPAQHALTQIVRDKQLNPIDVAQPREPVQTDGITHSLGVWGN